MRRNTKIGDVFEVKMLNGNKKYFQLIAFDLLQLNSDVIRAFKTEYAGSETPQIEKVVNEPVDFYTHCVTKIGLKLNLWALMGNSLLLGDLSDALFRSSSDSGCIVGQQKLISEKWYIWRLGDTHFTDVGKLEGINRAAELGLVVNPYDVVDRMNTGQFNFFYPGYE